MEEETTGVHSSHQTCPPIHGHGGRFLLHGGILEHITGDADGGDCPAAGLSSQEIHRHDGLSGDEVVGNEAKPSIPREMVHSPGRGGNFHLHGGHLEHVIGDEDNRSRPGAGISSPTEGNDKHLRCCENEFVGTAKEPIIPSVIGHCTGRGGNFHLHAGHLEHVIGDEDDVSHQAAGMTTAELDRNQQEEKENPITATVDTGATRPVDHVSGHGGNFHLHGGHLEHVIGDADENPPPAGMSTAELSKLH